MKHEPSPGHVPRTLRMALEHILAEARADRLGAAEGGWSCMYDYGKGRHCGIGCLFSEAQLADIRRRGSNGHSIWRLALVVGHDNLRFVTGMNPPQMSAMQELHDSYSGGRRKERIIEVIGRILAAGGGTINGVQFSMGAV